MSKTESAIPKPPDRPLLLRYVVVGEGCAGRRFSPFSASLSLHPFKLVSKLVIKMSQVHPSLSSITICAALTTCIHDGQFLVALLTQPLPTPHQTHPPPNSSPAGAFSALLHTLKSLLAKSKC